MNLLPVSTEVPSAPGRPHIEEIGEDFIRLAWDLPTTDGGTPIQHYMLEQREIRDPRHVHTHQLAVPPPPYTVHHLVEGSQYEFRIFAKNAAGMSPASPLSKSVVCRTPGTLKCL